MSFGDINVTKDNSNEQKRKVCKKNTEEVLEKLAQDIRTQCLHWNGFFFTDAHKLASFALLPTFFVQIESILAVFSLFVPDDVSNCETRCKWEKGIIFQGCRFHWSTLFLVAHLRRIWKNSCIVQSLSKLINMLSD